MQQSSRAVRQLPAGHGQTIYAYCNVRTNQVLYSLERTLRQAHLSQLADVGANNNPPTLRKDIWRPLFTVALPDAQQGLAVFKSLREYRRLHETTWELPKEITTPYTEKQIEKVRKRLEDRGGSKKETVFDVIKHEKHKMRVKMVMDQKANSVADLAAILLRQEEKSMTTATLRDLTKEESRREMILEIDNLARAYHNSGTEALDKQIAELKAAATSARAKGHDQSNKGKQRKEELNKVKKASQTLSRLRLRRRKMMYAVKAVADAKKAVEDAKKAAEEAREAAEEARKARAAEEAKSVFGMFKSSRAATATEEIPETTVELDYTKYIEPYPPALDPMLAAQEGLEASKKMQAQKKYRDQVRLLRAPVYTTEGVAIRWANTLDAEYAEMWPNGVQHEYMGFVRNTAPAPDQPIVDKVQDFMSSKTKLRLVHENAAQQEDATAEDQPCDETGVLSRAAVLADVKRQILEQMKSPKEKPEWIRRKKEHATVPEKTIPQPTGGETKIDTSAAAEPTSSPDAPPL